MVYDLMTEKRIYYHCLIIEVETSSPWDESRPQPYFAKLTHKKNF